MVKKALILAAGLGTRLAPMTDDKPKSLIEVNGIPIIMKQLENLLSNNVSDITVVVGYKADILQKAILDKYPKIKIVVSWDFAITNNMYSAYLGLKEMFSDSKYEPFFMMNADVFFDSSVISALQKDKRGNLIVVDSERYMDESMKITVSEGRIIAISKEISKEDASGCSIDVYKFDENGGKAFFDRCKFYIESEQKMRLWSEVAINDVLAL